MPEGGKRMGRKEVFELGKGRRRRVVGASARLHWHGRQLAEPWLTTC